MPKNVKCAQCKHERIVGIYSQNAQGYTGYSCMADHSIKLDKNIAQKLRECRFFKSRTETAWQEVRRQICKRLPGFIIMVLRVIGVSMREKTK